MENMQQFMPTILMMVAIFAIMYFFMTRPQQKKQKEIQDFRNSIDKGSQVLINGSIYGKVTKVLEEENALMVEVADHVSIKVDRNSVFATAMPATDK